MMRLYTIFLVSILLINTPVFSLLCYECTDPLNLNLPCEKNWKEVPKVQCTDGQVCTVDVLSKPGVKILRKGCNPSDHCDKLEAEYLNAPAVDVLHCKICSEDDCNGNYTSSSTVSFISFVTLSLVLCFVYVNR